MGELEIIGDLGGIGLAGWLDSECGDMICVCVTCGLGGIGLLGG